jgi:hypothetical protein
MITYEFLFYALWAFVVLGLLCWTIVRVRAGTGAQRLSAWSPRRLARAHHGQMNAYVYGRPGVGTFEVVRLPAPMDVETIRYGDSLHSKTITILRARPFDWARDDEEMNDAHHRTDG